MLVPRRWSDIGIFGEEKSHQTIARYPAVGHGLRQLSVKKSCKTARLSGMFQRHRAHHVPLPIRRDTFSSLECVVFRSPPPTALPPHDAYTPCGCRKLYLLAFCSVRKRKHILSADHVWSTICCQRTSCQRAVSSLAPRALAPVVTVVVWQCHSDTR